MSLEFLVSFLCAATKYVEQCVFRSLLLLGYFPKACDARSTYIHVLRNDAFEPDAAAVGWLAITACVAATLGWSTVNVSIQ